MKLMKTLKNTIEAVLCVIALPFVLLFDPPDTTYKDPYA